MDHSRVFNITSWQYGAMLPSFLYIDKTDQRPHINHGLPRPPVVSKTLKTSLPKVFFKIELRDNTCQFYFK